MGKVKWEQQTASKPSGESNKAKTTTKDKNPENVKNTAGNAVKWTKEDKQTLLLALETHGENNISAISELLPHMSETAIKRKISVYSALAEHLYSNKVLNNWLVSGMCKPKNLADAILFICLFEKQSSSLSKGINFRNVYEILYKAFINQIEPCTLIKTRELQLIWKLLNELDKAVWPDFMNELFDYLSKNYKKRNISKIYKKRKDTINSVTMEVDAVENKTEFFS